MAQAGPSLRLLLVRLVLLLLLLMLLPSVDLEVLNRQRSPE
jgi:hypothetical protein